MSYKDEDGDFEIKSRRREINDGGFAKHFAGRTPLWYYILREAEWYGCTKPLAAKYLAHATAHEEADKATKKALTSAASF